MPVLAVYGFYPNNNGRRGALILLCPLLFGSLSVCHNFCYTTRNLPIASIVAFAFDKTVCGSEINTELEYEAVPDVEAIALVTGT